MLPVLRRLLSALGRESRDAELPLLAPEELAPPVRQCADRAGHRVAPAALRWARSGFSAAEEEDVHPRLAELLRAHSAEFSALGLDIRTVSSRINI